MKSALIGHTGFIGGELMRRHQFDDFYNSKNIESIAGKSYDLIVCCGMPAVKWVANKEPVADRAVLDRLSSCLLQAKTEQLVVVSTADVYPNPVIVDEDTPIPITESSQAYGKHRLMLEQIAAEHFPGTLVIRLPGMFGPGLKKNALYDLLNNHETHKIHSDWVIQYFNVERVWDDLQKALAAKLSLVNFVTEPVRVGDVAKRAFAMDFINDTGNPPVKYDIRTKHAAVFGGRGGYLYDQKQVIAEIRDWVRREREAKS